MHWTKILQDVPITPEALAWAQQQDGPTQAWKACKRGDWMLYYLRYVGEREEVLQIAADFIERHEGVNKEKLSLVRECILSRSDEAYEKAYQATTNNETPEDFLLLSASGTDIAAWSIMEAVKGEDQEKLADAVRSLLKVE